MNSFVNLQKRSVQLPKGCKDLIDVLRLPSALNTVDRIEVGRLADTDHYLSQLLQSAGKLKMLLISSLDGQAGKVLIHDEGALTVTIFVDSVREEAVRSLFVEAGINPTWDYAMNNERVATRGLIYPLPADAPRAAQLTIDLMRRAYGLADEAEVEFLYAERDAA